MSEDYAPDSRYRCPRCGVLVVHKGVVSRHHLEEARHFKFAIEKMQADKAAQGELPA